MQNITVEQVRVILDRIVSLGSFVVKWTPNDVDNKIFDVLASFVNQPWFADFVVQLLKTFDPTQPVTQEDVLKVLSNIKL